MKRFAIAAAAALTLVSPLAATSAAAQQYGRDHDRRDNDGRRDNDRRDNDRRDNDRWDGRRDNDRRANRWERNRHNGYYVNGRWYYGAPSAAIMARRDFRADYHQWRRGDRLPSYYRSHYRQVDYRRERLRAPPRGYQYVRGDRGELLLVGIATGVILSVLLSAN